MKQKKVAASAEESIKDIAAYIHADNPGAARRYVAATLQTFADFEERFLPRRASEALPEYVREMQVPGFSGYTLRIAVLADQIVLVAAFAPGLSTARKERMTRSGLDEV